MFSELWPWLALGGLGAFHGINPAMGWLFAVALGLHRERRSVVFISLLPIAAGHAISVALVAFLAMAAGVVIDRRLIQIFAGLVLISWALYHLFARHRVRFGIQVSYLGFSAWSFLTASSHGAGLMLIPVLIPLQTSEHTAHAAGLQASLGVALTAVGVHSLAMLVTTGIVAIAVYQWIGLSVLRRGWFNLDRLWTFALVATGMLLLATAVLGKS